MQPYITAHSSRCSRIQQRIVSVGVRWVRRALLGAGACALLGSSWAAGAPGSLAPVVGGAEDAEGRGREVRRAELHVLVHAAKSAERECQHQS